MADYPRILVIWNNMEDACVKTSIEKSSIVAWLKAAVKINSVVLDQLKDCKDMTIFRLTLAEVFDMKEVDLDLTEDPPAPRKPADEEDEDAGLDEEEEAAPSAPSWRSYALALVVIVSLCGLSLLALGVLATTDLGKDLGFLDVFRQSSGQVRQVDLGETKAIRAKTDPGGQGLFVGYLSPNPASVFTIQDSGQGIKSFTDPGMYKKDQTGPSLIRGQIYAVTFLKDAPGTALFEEASSGAAYFVPADAFTPGREELVPVSKHPGILAKLESIDATKGITGGIGAINGPYKWLILFLFALLIGAVILEVLVQKRVGTLLLTAITLGLFLVLQKETPASVAKWVYLAGFVAILNIGYRNLVGEISEVLGRVKDKAQIPAELEEYMKHDPLQKLLFSVEWSGANYWVGMQLALAFMDPNLSMLTLGFGHVGGIVVALATVAVTAGLESSARGKKSDWFLLFLVVLAAVVATLWLGFSAWMGITAWWVWVFAAFGISIAAIVILVVGMASTSDMIERDRAPDGMAWLALLSLLGVLLVSFL